MIGGDLDERQFPDEGRTIGDVLDAQHVHEFLEVRHDPQGAAGIGLRHRGHPRDARASLCPTVSEWMLNPRRRKSEATRLRTPGWSST